MSYCFQPVPIFTVQSKNASSLKLPIIQFSRWKFTIRTKIPVVWKYVGVQKIPQNQYFRINIFFQRIKTHFRFFMTYPKIRIGKMLINTHKIYGELRFLNVICNTQSITDLYGIGLPVFLYIKLIRSSLHIVFCIIKRQFFILLTFSSLSYDLLPSISLPAPQSHNRIHRPHPP